MKISNISNKALSILSLLIIPGILLMPAPSTYLMHDYLIILPMLMCLIGGLSLGLLLGRTFF